MSKKTRKKSLATRTPRKAAGSAKPSGRSASKASKPVSMKDSAAKRRPAKATARKTPAKPSAASSRSKPATAKVKASTPKAKPAASAPPAPKAPAMTGSPGPAPRKAAAKAGTRSESAGIESAKIESAKIDGAKPVERNAAPVPAGDSLAPGRAAPGFDLPRDGGGRVALKDFAGRKLVLFFYPRASTPGCTKEAMDFTRLKGEFAASGADVIGVSADSIKAQDSFRDKYMLKVPLISDENQELLKAYGAWGEKSMYGKTFLGIIRTTVLIDAKGRIARIWRHVKVDGHADEVLAAAKAL